MDGIGSELLVARKPRMADKLLRIFAYALTVLAVIAAIFITPLAMLALIAMLLIDHFLVPRLSVEYEYTCVDGDIDIDAIYGKQRRKRMASIAAEEIECVARQGADVLHDFRTQKTADYSAGEADDPPWVVVVSGRGERTAYLLQMDEKMVDTLRMRVPGKVKLS